eukprot:scaffold33620_cov22-Tisochrysis_lutea.AAC.2
MYALHTPGQRNGMHLRPGCGGKARKPPPAHSALMLACDKNNLASELHRTHSKQHAQFVKKLDLFLSTAQPPLTANGNGS